MADDHRSPRFSRWVVVKCKTKGYGQKVVADDADHHLVLGYGLL